MKSSIQVRRIRVAEIPALRILYREAIFSIPDYSAKHRNMFLRKYSVTNIRKRLKKNMAFCLVAVVDGELAGFIWGSAMKRDESGVYWMNWIGVSIKFRRRGIARALMSDLERRLRKLGYHKIWFNIDPQNNRSQKTFRSFGFHKIALIRHHWYGLDAMIWNKELQKVPK